VHQFSGSASDNLVIRIGTQEMQQRTFIAGMAA
jgi:hypothetical protein